MSQKIIQDEFDAPLDADLEQLPKRRWSLLTLLAARPNSKYDTRAQAEAWNREYASIERLQVNLDEFRESLPEPEPEIVEAHWKRLERLSREMPKLKVVDIWNRPE